MGMEWEVLGWPPDGPTLRLDYRRFAYAGKFVLTNTGTAVVREPGGDLPPVDDDRPFAGDWDRDVVAAASFNADRTAPKTLWIRYITVRRDRRGEGLGPRLAAFVVDRAGEREYDRLRIAVNNPFAYEALHRAGFGWTGRETGVAELVLERPAARPDDPDRATYQAGLDVFRERDLGEPEASFLADRDGADPPDPAEWEAGDG